MRLQRKDMQLITNIKWRHTRSGLDVWLNLLKEALENSQTSAVDFVEDFKMNLYSKEICFTPKGDIKSLPKGATSLDFAFSIHSEIGIKTRGTCKREISPLNYELKMVTK
jgi:GTP pyrophosphokinase